MHGAKSGAIFGTYNIHTLTRLKPEWFRQDLITLFDLLKQKTIRPLTAHRFPLSQARRAQQLLEKEGATDKIELETKTHHEGV